MSAQTQLLEARAGRVTSAMRTVADKVAMPVEAIRDGVARGHIIIPCNHHHASLDPIGIGRALTVKINANIGNSSLSSGPDAEHAKLCCAIRHGADTVMDLSTGEQVNEIRARLLERSSVPIGTVPIYQALNMVDDPMDITPDLLLEVIRMQAEQGVDYMTVHAGLLREHVPLARDRLLGIVSRGGSITAQWMIRHHLENPLFTHFDDLLAICREHDVSLSLGDGLRPGCLADASDAAQFAELDVLAGLVGRSREAGVQVMVEGPGHIPLNEVQMNMEKERLGCDDAPFYILGPVVVDCAPGYDHITSAIGAAVGAWHGASMLCYVTPKEHLGLPNERDVREGVIAYRIAAHAADVAKGHPGARLRDDAISRARADFDWERQFDLALDPERARELRAEALREQRAAPDAGPDEHPRHCTMCGPKYCSMRISSELWRGWSPEPDRA